MSMDRSFKGANMLVRHRNVLNRAERLEVLKDQEKWDEQKSVFGLPKVAHRKAAVVKAAKEEVAAVGVEGEAPVAGAATAAPAAGAKPAAAAKAPAGAKAPAAAAAPAAKGKK
jgi:small basic protein (TIGR04137 family)